MLMAQQKILGATVTRYDCTRHRVTAYGVTDVTYCAAAQCKHNRMHNTHDPKSLICIGIGSYCAYCVYCVRFRRIYTFMFGAHTLCGLDIGTRKSASILPELGTIGTIPDMRTVKRPKSLSSLGFRSSNILYLLCLHSAQCKKCCAQYPAPSSKVYNQQQLGGTQCLSSTL